MQTNLLPIHLNALSLFFRETVQQERKDKEDITKECDTRLKSNLDTIQQLHQQVSILVVLTLQFIQL